MRIGHIFFYSILVVQKAIGPNLVHIVDNIHEWKVPDKVQEGNTDFVKRLRMNWLTCSNGRSSEGL